VTCPSRDVGDYLNAHSTQTEAYLADTYIADLEGGSSRGDQSAAFVSGGACELLGDLAHAAQVANANGQEVAVSTNRPVE